MNWFKKFLIKMAVKQLDGLKPVIMMQVVKAQMAMASIPPEQFADNLVNDLETAIFDKIGIPEEDR